MALIAKRTVELGDGILIDVDPKLDTIVIRVGQERKVVKKVDLWAICFTIADPKTQELLMPVRQTEVATFKRIHAIQVTKPMKPGDMIKVQCEISVPQVVEEGLAGTLTKKRSPIALPK